MIGCDIQFVAAVTRAVTNVIATLGGVLCIFLGYRLYQSGIRSEVSASASRAGWSGTLRATGPGVFLVLFGSAILGSVVFTRSSFTQDSRSVEKHAVLSLFDANAGTVDSAQIGSNSKPVKKNALGCKDTYRENETKITIQFVNGGPTAHERVVDAVDTSLGLVEDAIARGPSDLRKLRSLELTRDTLKSMREKLDDE